MRVAPGSSWPEGHGMKMPEVEVQRTMLWGWRSSSQGV